MHRKWLEFQTRGLSTRKTCHTRQLQVPYSAHRSHEKELFTSQTYFSDLELFNVEKISQK